MPSVNIGSKHLRKGDPLPPWNNKLRVYSLRTCPFAHRIILALNAKQIDYEIVNIDLADKPEWITSKSAFGTIPAIEIEDGVTIFESSVIVEYLDEVYPKRPLLPKDPFKKAYDKIIVEACGPMGTFYLKLMKAPQTINEDIINAYFRALDFIQDQLRSRNTIFLDGSEPGYADYILWPWFERFTNLDDERVKIEAPKYSLLLEYIENMLKDPIVSQYVLPKEIYDKLHKEYPAGKFKIQSIE